MRICSKKMSFYLVEKKNLKKNLMKNPKMIKIVNIITQIQFNIMIKILITMFAIKIKIINIKNKIKKCGIKSKFIKDLNLLIYLKIFK